MKIRYSFVILLSLVLLIGCSSAGADGKLKKIVFADAKWDSIQVHSYIAGKILEAGYGYETELMAGSTAATIQGLRQGDIHVYMEIWTENIRDVYDEAINSGDIEKVSTNFADNDQGLYVPAYVIEGDEERGIEPLAPDLETVEDLKKYPHIFKDPENPDRGRIINAPAGWEVDQSIKAKMAYYGLDETYNDFMPGSDAAIITSLAAAYEKGEAWVGYYWEPTAVTAKYDLILLKEEPYDEEKWIETSGTAFPPNEVNIAVNHQLSDQAPEVVDLLSKYETSSELTEAALAYMEKQAANAEEAAIWWLTEYEDVWTEWVDKETAQKVKDSL
ncbi:ABC transporter substrate-binding protein [Virgibacillus soli]|uniref:ABC transporter substrate-binding protein n=1 Tax=Paracerasibacillus soli TaxID=480284 RepID=UPI0035F09BFA